MKRQTNWIVGVSDGKVHEYKIGDVTYFVSAEFERSSQTNLRDRVQRTVVSNLIPLTPGQASDTIAANMCVRLPGRRTYAVEKEKRTIGINSAVLPPVP
ncbi:MAG: hypothetical protein UGF91_04160 [Dialister invisus]|nr:hypothetical protein [Dialister invisus]